MLQLLISTAVRPSTSRATATAPSNNVAAAIAATATLLDRTPFDQIILKEGDKSLEVMPLELPQRPLASLPATGSLKIPRCSIGRPKSLKSRLPTSPKFAFSNSNCSTKADASPPPATSTKPTTTSAGCCGDYPSYPGLERCDQRLPASKRARALSVEATRPRARATAHASPARSEFRRPWRCRLDGRQRNHRALPARRQLRGRTQRARTVANTVRRVWPTTRRPNGNDVSKPPPRASWRKRRDSCRRRTTSLREPPSPRRSASGPNSLRLRTSLPRSSANFPSSRSACSNKRPAQPQRRIDCWPAMRGSRLTQHLLAEEVDFGAEGGIYRSPFGKFEPDETGRALTLTLDRRSDRQGYWICAYTRCAGSLSARHDASRLVRCIRADFANLLSGVAIAPDAVQDRVYASSRATRSAAADSATAWPPSDYAIAEYSPDQVVFAAPQSSSARPAGLRAIVEQTFADDDAAVAALG